MNESMPTSPDSLPNNYDMQIAEGNLIVAEARANHSYTEHPHYEDAGVHLQNPKTRGIVYNETELGGKPFIIAERPQAHGHEATVENSDESVSQSQEQSSESEASEDRDYAPNWTSPTANEDNTEGAERQPNRNGIFVKHEADEDGMVQRAIEYTQPGQSIDWAHIPGADRRVLLRDISGNQYYVVGDICYDLGASFREGKLIGSGRPGEQPDFDKVTIGEEWNMDGFTYTPHIMKALIKLDSVSDNGGEAVGDERGKDPFREADELIAELRESEVHREGSPEADTEELEAASWFNNHQTEEPINDPSPDGRLKRARRVMGRAAFALRALPYLAKYKIGNGIERAREYFSDEEKGRRRKVVAAVAGALVLAGATYLELKGSGTHSPRHHTPRHHAAPRGHGIDPNTIHLQEGQNPWTESRHELKLHGNAHPTNAQIEAYDKQMAADNPDVYRYFGDSSEHIPAGTGLRLPQLR